MFATCSTSEHDGIFAPQTPIARRRHHPELATEIETAAQRLIVHPNTIRYRIGRFEELTGCDLRQAHTGAQAWWAIQYDRLVCRSAANGASANR